jgi:hypothetical protein
MFRARLEVGVDGLVLRLAGRLTVEYVEEAERLCISAEPPVLVDASELRSCDPDGLAFLARVRAGTVRVEGLSEYLLMRVRVLEKRGSSGTLR